MDKFKLVAPYSPMGDQIEAIKRISENLEMGIKEQTLLGATGTGKTFTVANVITSFDPEKVVIGGGVINGGDIVLEAIKEEVAKRCMKVFVDSCSIEKAKLGGQAGVLGAAALAIME